MASTQSRTEIADRAAVQFVGKQGIPCGRCQSHLAYVNIMGHIKCRTCDYPAKPEYVRLPLVLVQFDSVYKWQDGRVESRLEKLSDSSGVDIVPLRVFNNLAVELKFPGTIWPPRLDKQ